MLAVLLSDTLRAKACTYVELMAVSKLKLPTLSRWIKALRDPAVGAVYIAGWAEDKNGRLFVAKYRWGRKPDAPRPGQGRTGSDRMRDCRARKKLAAA